MTEQEIIQHLKSLPAEVRAELIEAFEKSRWWRLNAISEGLDARDEAMERRYVEFAERALAALSADVSETDR